jgi:hypothetical protein
MKKAGLFYRRSLYSAENREGNRNFVGVIASWKHRFGRPRRRCKDNKKNDLSDTCCDEDR